MRKHRLAECLLADVFGLAWEQVQTEACRWEHVMCESVERRLLELLGHPTAARTATRSRVSTNWSRTAARMLTPFPPSGDCAVTLFGVAGSVRPDMIETVRQHIDDALARTSDSSTLSEDAQDAELAQASAEGCDLLTQWLGSFEWEQLRPAGTAPISDAIPEWERIRPFLDPLVEAMARFSQRQSKTRDTRNGPDPAAHIDELLRNACRTARRYKRYNREQLFAEACLRTQALRDEVCRLAAEFTTEKAANSSSAAKAERRRRVRTVLGTISTLLLTVSLALASASPHDMQQNIPQWGHEAVKVLMVFDIAQTAQPGVQVTPPRLGPRVR